MTEIVYGSKFLKSVKKLPEKIQIKLSKQLALLKRNPFSSPLQTKPLTGQLTGFYSFRITRDWRVIFQFLRKDKIQLLQAKNRKDIYR